MRIAICDDEKKFLIRLRNLIVKSYPASGKLRILDNL